MKAHYPAAYTAAVLNAQQNTDINGASVKILPPSIQQSKAGYSVLGDGVLMGFSAIKNVGIQVAEHIVAERNKGQFQSFDDFVSRMPSGDLNKKSLESLILAGVFDIFGVTRRSLFNVYEKMIEDAHKSVRDNVSGQLDMFSMGEESSISASAYDYPNLPEFPMRDLLRMEISLLLIRITLKSFVPIAYKMFCAGKSTVIKTDNLCALQV